MAVNIFLALGLFALALALRLVACRGTVVDFDEYGHFYFVKRLKANHGGPFDPVSTAVVGAQPLYRPFIWHWFVGLIPQVILEKYRKAWNPLLDAAFSVLLFFTVFWLGFSLLEAFLCFCLYLFTPLWFTRLSIGPRVASFTPRLSGELAANGFFLIVCLPLGLPLWAVLFSGALASAYLVGSSKFGVQAALFLTPLISVFVGSWVPIVSLLLGVLVLLIFSQGQFFLSLKQQLVHLRWYFLNNIRGRMSVSSRNKIDDQYKRRKSESVAHYGGRLLIMFIGRNTYTGVVLKLPVLWVTLVVYGLSPDVLLPAPYWGVVLGAFIVFAMVNIPQFLFLGESERYLNHVAFFIVVAAVGIAKQTGFLWIYWGLVAYGAIYLFCESFLLPRLTSVKEDSEEDNQKIIRFLGDTPKMSATVLSFPYHAGGGVFRIMGEADQRVVYPGCGVSSEFLTSFERKYSISYPFTDLKKLDEMRAELGVNVLIVRVKEMREQMGESWAPSSAWQEVDLPLMLQRVFVSRDFKFK